MVDESGLGESPTPDTKNDPVVTNQPVTIELTEEVQPEEGGIAENDMAPIQAESADVGPLA